MPGRSIQGVLFLAAGFGTRAEPLSFARPKSLLPLEDSTLLGSLLRQFKELDPEVMAINASRCPELLLEEMRRHWKGRIELLFEERPLGTVGTISRNSGLFRGTWVLSNTDFAMEVPVSDLVEDHFNKDSSWTVLTGGFPEKGKYRSLDIGGAKSHYLGVSVISSEIAGIASGEQAVSGLFTGLRTAALSRGYSLNGYFSDREWIDMGETELFRKHTLARGCYIHPGATVQPGSVLEGFYWIGPSCMIKAGSRVKNTVMLQGSSVLSGASAVNTVLPWFYKRSPD